MNYYARASIEGDSPAAAWQYLSEANLSLGERREIMSDALVFEMNRDFQAAPNLLQWVGENADWFDNAKAVRKMVNNWQITDRQAAKEWASQHKNLLGESEE